jgi:alpha-glucan,water dikinase
LCCDPAAQAAAVIDRIRRAISTISDNVSAQLEPIATSLGKAFGVADWAVELFSEEARY